VPQQSKKNKITQSIFKEDTESISTQIDNGKDVDFVPKKIEEFFEEYLGLGGTTISDIIIEKLKEKKIYNNENESYVKLAKDLQCSESSVSKFFGGRQKTTKRTLFKRIIIIACIDSATEDKLLWNMIKAKNQKNVSYKDKEDIFIRAVSHSINKFEKEYYLIEAEEKRIIANRLALKNGIKYPFDEEDEEAQ